MKNNKLFLAGMAVKAILIAMLALGLVLTGCPTEPPAAGKPTRLASDATHAQAMAKLDDIIAYSGTPEATKTLAQQMKTTYGTSVISSSWSTYRTLVVGQINQLIGQIP